MIRDVVYIGRNTVASQPLMVNDLAPSLNCQDNLFDGCQLTIGGFSLGSRTKLAPQISACEKRIMKSAGWINGAGRSSQCFGIEFQERRNDICSDGVNIDETLQNEQAQVPGTLELFASTAIVGVGTEFKEDLSIGREYITGGGQVFTVATITDDLNATSVETNVAEGPGALFFLNVDNSTAQSNANERLYQPPLGIFKQGKALPPARYELILRPKPDLVYKQSALQSTGFNKDILSGANAGDLANGTAEYLIEDIVFFIAVVDNYERVADQMSYVLDLEETEVLPRQISGAAITENYTVSKSTFGLSVALQDKRAGRNTLYPPSIFKVQGDTQQQLTSLRLDYAGQSRPQPDAQPAFEKIDAGTPLKGFKDYETYRYAETAVEDLAYYDTGGVLTKDDWRELGELYHFQFRKVGDDISTNVDVSVTYPAFQNGPHNLLLFHHFRRVIEMQIESGQVTNFLAQDA